MEGRTAQFDRIAERYLQLISGTRSPSTVRRYQGEIGFFIRYLKKAHPEFSSFSKLQRSDIEAWLRHLATRKSRYGRPLQKRSRRHSIVLIRRFLEDITAWGWRGAPEEPLFRRGDAPPEDRQLPRPLSEDADRALQKELRRRGGLLPAALLLLRATGLRVQEFLDLKVDSLEKLPEDRWALHVPLGKLHSERVVPLDVEAAENFNQICLLRGDSAARTDRVTGKLAHFLVAHRNGKPYTSNALRLILVSAAAEAQVQERVTPHRLRHTYATQMLRAGMSLPVLMKILGHRTIRMTMRYVEVTQQDVHRAYLQASETIKNRYSIPQPPATQTLAEEHAPPNEVGISILKTAASSLEAMRRDHAMGTLQNKRLQRLVERLRRLARDFQALWA